MSTIMIFRGANAWMARFSDPAVKEALGTDTIPTAFTLAAKPEDVIDRISSLNPHCAVSLED